MTNYYNQSMNYEKRISTYNKYFNITRFIAHTRHYHNIFQSYIDALINI